jgi:hypothetical protein
LRFADPVSFIPLLDGTSLSSGLEKPDDGIDDAAMNRCAENSSTAYDN